MPSASTATPTACSPAMRKVLMLLTKHGSSTATLSPAARYAPRRRSTASTAPFVTVMSWPSGQSPASQRRASTSSSGSTVASPYRRGRYGLRDRAAPTSGSQARFGLPPPRSASGEPGSRPSCSPGSRCARMAVPKRPCVTAIPAVTRRWYASDTVLRLTPRVAASSRTVGSSWPGSKSPACVSARMLSNSSAAVFPAIFTIVSDMIYFGIGQ
ncbi:hypothetical protein D3C72_1749300 [compost metagenome]